MYTQAVASFWTPAEIDLESDRRDWESLTPGERYFIINILAFFAGSDGIVTENLAVNFIRIVQIPGLFVFFFTTL